MTLLDSVIRGLELATRYARSEVPPTAVLWTDSKSEWLPLLERSTLHDSVQAIWTRVSQGQRGRVMSKRSRKPKSGHALALFKSFSRCNLQLSLADVPETNCGNILEGKHLGESHRIISKTEEALC